MKKSVMLILCVGLFIISCSKDTSIDEQKKATQKKQLLEVQKSSQAPPCYTTIIEVANQENPFDYAGDWHNAALDHAATLVDVTDVEPDDMYAAIKDFYLNQEISQSFNAFLENQESPTDFLSEYHLENGLDIETFKNEYLDESEEVFGNILNDVSSIVFEDYGSTEIQSIANEIISYENNFFISYQGNKAIKFYSFFSILRHSLKYWMEAYQNECHPYYELVNSTINNQSRIIPISVLIRLGVDYAVHQECLKNGGLGATESLQQAMDNCFPDAVYSSFRAFDGPELPDNGK